MLSKLIGFAAIATLAIFPLSGCNYLKYSRIQAEYRELQRLDPSQRNLKHLIDRQNFGVIGQIVDPDGVIDDDVSIAIAAFSSAFKPHELVATNHLVRVDRHFGFDLPAGEYDIVVLADRNEDGRYDQTEAVSATSLRLSEQDFPAMVVPSFLVRLQPRALVDWEIGLEARPESQREESLFYPVGALRSLDDPIFDKDAAVLGQYDPAAFLELYPTTFYALEEDLGHKMPIIFVHGISGSPREFQYLVERIDRKRFRPWFYFYPSGGDLAQMGELFYDVFLSGETVQIDKSVPIAIVAHSMGGLVVREALNIRAAQSEPASPIEFISLATPFGGHPSARLAESAGGMVLPSWRDLNPDSDFIADLYRRPLPEDVRHHLVFAFLGEDPNDVENGTDGVVPLGSQLSEPVSQAAASRAGFQSGHAEILQDAGTADYLVELLGDLRIDAPEHHGAYVEKGGFEVGAGFTRMEQYLLRHYGYYLRALAEGEIDPANDWQRRLLPMLRGETSPDFPAASAWLKYAAGLGAPASEE